MNVRKQRSKQLHILSDKKKRAFYDANVGQTGTVLFETDNNDGWMNGFTENYVKVKVPYDPKLANTFQYVHLNSIAPDGMMFCDIIVTAET